MKRSSAFHSWVDIFIITQFTSISITLQASSDVRCGVVILVMMVGSLVERRQLLLGLCEFFLKAKQIGLLLQYKKLAANRSRRTFALIGCSSRSGLTNMTISSKKCNNPTRGSGFAKEPRLVAVATLFQFARRDLACSVVEN